MRAIWGCMIVKKIGSWAGCTDMIFVLNRSFERCCLEKGFTGWVDFVRAI